MLILHSNDETSKSKYRGKIADLNNSVVVRIVVTRGRAGTGAHTVGHRRRSMAVTVVAIVAVAVVVVAA